GVSGASDVFETREGIETCAAGVLLCTLQHQADSDGTIIPDCVTNCVCAASAVEHIVAKPAVDNVVSITRDDDVVLRCACQLLGAARAGDMNAVAAAPVGERPAAGVEQSTGGHGNVDLIGGERVARDRKHVAQAAAELAP